MRSKKNKTQDNILFPQKLSNRLLILSQPKKYYGDTEDGMPRYTKIGTRISALNGRLPERNSDIAWPYVRNLMLLKKNYKNKFSRKRLKRIDRMIEAANATMYSKLANSSIDLKKKDIERKKRARSESEWKRHMDYISQIARPKKVFPPPPVMRGKSKPLNELMPRLIEISSKPDFKTYKRLSQEPWYRNPEKVPPNALKYVISKRIKELAVAKTIPNADS